MRISQSSSHSPKWLSNALIISTVVYIALLLLSPSNVLPGDPIWAIQPETLQEIIKESINFFFVLPILNRLGFHAMQAPVVHPLMQAFFNFAEAWIFMFLPLMMLDPRGGKLPKVLIWSLAMFLTNIFLMPYMAARLLSDTDAEKGERGRLARSFGLIGLGVGLVGLVWTFWTQPDVGGLSERFAYFVEQVSGNRVTLAFCVDLILFYIFQIWLMGAVIDVSEKAGWLRFIPFWGLAIWLML